MTVQFELDSVRLRAAYIAVLYNCSVRNRLNEVVQCVVVYTHGGIEPLVQFVLGIHFEGLGSLGPQGRIGHLRIAVVVIIAFEGVGIAKGAAIEHLENRAWRLLVDQRGARRGDGAVSP